MGLPDGQGAGLALSGAVSVAGGAAVWRDLVGDDGFGDLLVTDADLLTSPGDVNGDGYADLVVRQASTGDVYFHGGTADHRVKAGWGSAPTSFLYSFQSAPVTSTATGAETCSAWTPPVCCGATTAPRPVA